ncbi:MAG: DndE family protein [Thermoguttaceae bacterium]
MAIKQIRLSSQAREQLIRLKTGTGIGRWKILCRWGFCLSLREPTPPTPIDAPADSNVENSPRRGRNKSAQGNALGSEARNRFTSPERAQQISSHQQVVAPFQGLGAVYALGPQGVALG